MLLVCMFSRADHLAFDQPFDDYLTLNDHLMCSSHLDIWSLVLQGPSMV